jgi:polysaccharide export outer membrane protein
MLTTISFLTLALLAPQRENYRIGIGDRLDVRVLGEEQMSTNSARVDADGNIKIPFVDEPIHALCRTELELREAITEKLKKWLRHPEVSVTVIEYNSTPVAIIGAVNSPGRFQSQRRMRLLELLTHAGGVRENAGRTLSVVHAPEDDPCEDPGDASQPTVDVISISELLAGNPAADQTLRPGDIVVVPQADLVFIAGEVHKPNAYPLRENLTLTQVVALAGGPLGTAKTDKIQIVRQEPGKPRTELVASLKAIQENRATDVLLMANDVIQVPGSGTKHFFKGLATTLGASVGSLPMTVIP